MLEKNDLGIVKISKEVIVGIASRSAKEITGVQAVGGGFLNRIARIFGMERFTSCKAEILSNGDIVVTVPIVVEYGKEISGIAYEVQEKVKKDIEEITGLDVVKIDVMVEEVK